MASIPKNIVLLSDGTGNAASKVWRTNVWRMFQALDLTSSRQVAMYDDGVGSSPFKPLALVGGACGWGLKRNVLDLYRFLCRNYEPGARIYAFGFSRGAFTIRVLLGLVATQGVLRYEREGDLHRQAVAAYRAYRKERFHSVLHVETIFRGIRDLGRRLIDTLKGRPPYEKRNNIDPPPVRFVGLWDTVAAYGLPIEEMTRGVSQWIWPLELPNRKLAATVTRACHALALDDERTTFHPVLWTETGETPAAPDRDGRRFTKDERISQVWFAGSHSNVGGGYPDDSLAHVPLLWMMHEASRCDLRFKVAPPADPDAVRNVQSAADKDGRLYDSRHGLGGYYRYGPRRIYDLCHRPPSRGQDDEVTVDLPKVHESALDRTLNGAHAYAPIGLPERYAVVTWEGEILEGTTNRFERPVEARARADAQERIWDFVWWRRLVYFATLAASGHLALFPLLYPTDPVNEFSTPLRLVSDAIRLVAAVLPSFAEWWIDAFASHPFRFLVGVAVLAGLMRTGVGLGYRINDRMLAIWRAILRARAAPTARSPGGFVYKLRTHPAYTGTHRALKRHIVPLVSAVLLLYLGVAALSHIAFDVGDAAGAFCTETEPGALKSVEEDRLARSEGFPSSSMCWPSRIQLVEGRRYRITIRDAADWRDRGDLVQPRGFELSELPTLEARFRLFLAIPLRRVVSRPWFRPIARIGAVGSDEYPLDPDTRPAPPRRDATVPSTRELVTEIRARRSGELFFYVNDAIVGLPKIADVYYRNNTGVANVEVRRLGLR